MNIGRPLFRARQFHAYPVREQHNAMLQDRDNQVMLQHNIQHQDNIAYNPRPYQDQQKGYSTGWHCVIGACPALFPCKNALPARNRLGVAQDTCLQESRPLARARRKQLSIRDLAAKAQRQQQRNQTRNITFRWLVN